MASLIKKIISTATFKHSAISLAGTLVNGLFALGFYILAARFLGPTSFGLVTFMIVVTTLLADLGSLGTDTGIIRFLGKHSKDLDSQKKIMKLSLETKAVVWVLLFTVGFFIAPFIANVILSKPEVSPFLRISLLGVGAVMFFSFVSNALQGLQRYSEWSLLNVSSNLFRLLLLVALFLTGLLTSVNISILYIGAPLLFFIIGLFLLPNFLGVKGEEKMRGEFFQYNKWIAVLSILATITSRVDLLYITKFLSVKDLGVYGLASQLVSVIPQIIFAIAASAAPKLSGMSSRVEAKAYLRKLQFLSFGVALVILFAAPIGFYILSLFFGKEYSNSFVPFMILTLANIIFLISLPSHQAIFYYFAKPKVFAIINSGNLVLTLILGLYLVPTFGLVGAAGLSLCSAIFNLILPAYFVRREFKDVKR